MVYKTIVLTVELIATVNALYPYIEQYNTFRKFVNR